MEHELFWESFVMVRLATAAQISFCKWDGQRYEVPPVVPPSPAVFHGSNDIRMMWWSNNTPLRSTQEIRSRQKPCRSNRGLLNLLASVHSCSMPFSRAC